MIVKRKVSAFCCLSGGFEAEVEFSNVEDKYSSTTITIKGNDEYGYPREFTATSVPIEDVLADRNHVVTLNLEGSYERRALASLFQELAAALSDERDLNWEASAPYNGEPGTVVLHGTDPCEGTQEIFNKVRESK